MKRKWMILPVLVLSALLLGGCGSRTVEQMYKIPMRSPEYQSLQNSIDHAMAGMEYAAPNSGENQQTVQMADLDGDGTDEYLVFARAKGEKPLMILIFKQAENREYLLLDRIETNGSNFEKVEYVDMDGLPGKELVVGRKLKNQIMRIASVYSFSGGQSDQLLSAIYTRCLTCDLDGDGRSELMIVRHGDSDSGDAAAVLYSYQDGNVERSREVALSEKLENIRRINLGRLYGGKEAVFVASSVSEDALVIDVLALKSGSFINIPRMTDSDTTVEALRNHFVYFEDVDGDGVEELPALITMKNVGVHKGQDRQRLIRWYALDIEGNEIDRFCTFHNYESGWYIQMDSRWAYRMAVEQDGSDYTFYMWNEEFREAVAVFTLYTLTGKDRDERAGMENRFALSRNEQIVYAGKLEPGSALYGFTEELLTNSFHLIRRDWQTGET